MTAVVPILLFLHLVAVAGLFAGTGIELAAFVLLRRARTVGEARATLLAVPSIGPIMGGSAATLILAGLGMVFAGNFGWQPWTVTGLLIAVALSANGSLTNGRRMARIHALATAAPDGPIPVDLDVARRDRFLTYSVGVVLTLLLCMLYVMSNKPALPACIITVALGLALPFVPLLRASETTSTVRVSERA